MSQTLRPTIASIAQAAQVSRASVYAVLNASKNTNIRVGEGIQKRILAVARELGYVRNEGARALVTGKSGTIGVMLTDMEHNFFAPALNAMYEAADASKRAISVAMNLWNLEREHQGISRFCGSRCEGIIWAPTQPEGEFFKSALELVEALEIPMVVLGISDNPSSNRVSQVGLLEGESTRLGFEYLHSLGHRRIAIATACAIKGNRSKLHRDRLKGMQETAESFGLSLDGLVFDSSDNSYGGIEIAKRIAGLPEEAKPTAVFAADDMLGRALIASFTCFGVRVPSQISILGYDDAPGNDEAVIPLSSVSLKSFEIGENAMKLLLDMIDGRLPRSPASKLILKPEISKRSSCAAFAKS